MITATILRHGTPQPKASTLSDGEEVVWTATGFRPGESVALSWDGQYTGYLTALWDGTWSIEWYNHHHSPPTAHNHLQAPGVHRFAARGDTGRTASLTLTTA
jgi:hypothetical protein